MNDTERYLFLALIEAVEDMELLFHSIAHRHQTLLIVLRDRGVITSRQYEEAVKERQAAGAVELAAWVAIPLAVGQDKPAESGAVDPRLKPLVGTWEGQLEGRFGLPGKGLERVVLSTELDGGRPKISFQVKKWQQL